MSGRWVDLLATTLARRTSRRGFLARTAVVGAAMVADPVNYLLRPASAYSTLCGEGSTCASGWTAFCVTINGGVNQCPPGSFSAGWWKADNAGVCGGHPRYYVDCNASCVDGRPGHYSCRCRCAPTHTCDQRRTCCNQFRYGQCHQQVACYGPVVCRVVSCVPPWRWDHCSRSAATDDRTRSHSAPALPHAWDHIERRYVALGGHASALGASVAGRHPVAGGITQIYQRGMLAWSEHTPAAMLLATTTAYRHHGGPSGALGFPTADERSTADGRGRLAPCVHGALYVGGGLAASALTGPLFNRWLALANHSAVAGRPRADATRTADGAGQVGVFQNGALLWSSATGAHLVVGAAAARYAALGRERSALGYPTADTAATADARGTLTTCQYGVIVSRADLGAWELTRSVAAYWQAAGGVTSALGYPTTGMHVSSASGADVARFEGGVVYSTASTGAHAVTGAILTTYDSYGADGGSLGLPTDDAHPQGGDTVQDFQGGVITYDPSTGTCTVQTTSPSPSPSPSATG